MSPTLSRFGLLWFTYFAGIGLFNTYAPLWFKALGMSTITIGAISALQAFTRMFAPYGWSWAADHGGHGVALIRLATGGALGCAALLWLLPLLAAWPPTAAAVAPWLVPAVVVLVAGLFIANGGVVPLAEAALSQLLITPQGVDTGRYGRVRMWGSIGFIVSVTAAGFALQALGLPAWPPAVAALNLALVLTAWRLPVVGEPGRHAEPAPPVWPLLKRPEVAWFYASVFCTVLAHVSLYAFLSLYLDALGYGKAAVGGLWAVAVTCEIAFFYTQGQWLHRMSPHGWLKASSAVAALRFAAVALGGQWAVVLVLAQASHAITFAAQHGACITLLARYFPGRLRGRGQALYTALGYGLSGLVGGLGGGWLIEHAGYAAVFWAAAASALLGWACAHRAERADTAARA
ncbi:MFS transporter [Ideonella sp. DXS22W]|uniref:MFS transporter n=1 Tax=Pseudaquabacterium inlustre TaxID=2984192 RepID=A0ABU9CJ82_9BURK